MQQERTRDVSFGGRSTRFVTVVDREENHKETLMREYIKRDHIFAVVLFGSNPPHPLNYRGTFLTYLLVFLSLQAYGKGG